MCVVVHKHGMTAVVMVHTVAKRQALPTSLGLSDMSSRPPKRPATSEGLSKVVQDGRNAVNTEESRKTPKTGEWVNKDLPPMGPGFCWLSCNKQLVPKKIKSG